MRKLLQSPFEQFWVLAVVLVLALGWQHRHTIQDYYSSDEDYQSAQIKNSISTLEPFSESYMPIYRHVPRPYSDHRYIVLVENYGWVFPVSFFILFFYPWLGIAANRSFQWSKKLLPHTKYGQLILWSLIYGVLFMFPLLFIDFLIDKSVANDFVNIYHVASEQKATLFILKGFFNHLKFYLLIFLLAELCRYVIYRRRLIVTKALSNTTY